ncbi:MAG: NADH-quinone oxidoreductase subunit A [Sedimentisphaerales bacterium]|jgi:NADH-quinone oxidoreductase subunit A
MLWPFVVYFAAVIAVVTGMLAISFFLGERHREKATGQPYESGVKSAGSAHLRFSIKFYLVALFFVIFDVESMFIFAWAIAFKGLGWVGYISIVVFIGILLAALVYLWQLGVLDWGTAKRGRTDRVRED